MRITPRYGPAPIITIAEPAGDPGRTVARQRRRLVETLGTLTDEQWHTPSRCADWTVQDVVAHLGDTNGFWRASMVAGLSGAPTTMLEGFDPKATPASLVDAGRAATPAETLARFVRSTEALLAVVESVGADQWEMPAEAPPGHLPVRLVAHHALWDAWVHERDILIPLGFGPPEEADEIAACLRYAAALAPSFAVMFAEAGRGVLAVEATDPDLHLAVRCDGHVDVSDDRAVACDVVLRGRAADLVEAFSIRAPLGVDVPEEHRWLVSGLADVFEETLR